MRFPRRALAVSLTLLVLVLLGSGIYLRIRGAGESSEGEETVATNGAAPTVSASESFATEIAIPVEGAPVVRDTLVLSVTAGGQAASPRQTVLKAQVAGRIVELPVRESDPVGGGALLLTLDPTEYELQVEEARAGLAQAEAQFQELTLFDDQIDDPEVRAARERVARAKSGLETAEVGLRRAELELARTRLHAPFAGRVASMQVVSGQWVSAGEELMTVVDLDPIRVEVQVLQGDVGYLAPGRRAAVSFAAFPNETFEGRIETINPLVDPESRAAKVTVTVSNPDGRILPGMYAEVSLEARYFPDRILVPRPAVIERDQRRTLVFVYEGDDAGGLAKWRYVTTGLQNDSLIEIIPGDDTEMLEPGEMVLVDGHYTLIHDANVRLVGDVASAGGRPN